MSWSVSITAERQVYGDFCALANQGADIIFVQELHPDITIEIPRGWRRKQADSDTPLCVIYKREKIEILNNTKEKVFPGKTKSRAKMRRRVELTNFVFGPNFFFKGRRGES